ncbi:MAG: galactarate dehydratase [Cyclobacteriaceae bacterium]
MMQETKRSIVIRITDQDNVGIVSSPEGLSKDSLLEARGVSREYVPMGHKVALTDFAEGDPILRYGVIIGHARQAIRLGEWIHEEKMDLPQPPELNQIPLPKAHNPSIEPLEGYTFEGYRNPDGSVGTRNVLGIITSVQCVAGLAQHVAEKVSAELLPRYPNVDAVVPINHAYGCGIAINSPLAEIPIRTIQNIVRNPNFGGEVLVLGLGCEKLRPERLFGDTDPDSAKDRILYMQDERFTGFAEMVSGAMQMAEVHLKKLNERQRETCPVSDLVVGMQCGGSDSFSGITGNPVAGFATDLIVRAGGSVMFSEVTEVRDAIHLLVPRATEPEVGKALIHEMAWYDAYLSRGQADRSANPSPGNKRGGLSNVVEKALGSIAKSGSSPIVDVIPPGARIKKKGLSFAATPASDFICGTLQLAAGMNLHVFITGRGTPYGLSMVPVVKIGTNSKLSQRWHDLIDLDAGPIATGEKTIEALGWELFHFMLEVASGRKQVACDKLGLHNDLVLFNPGPIT